MSINFMEMQLRYIVSNITSIMHVLETEKSSSKDQLMIKFYYNMH